MFCALNMVKCFFTKDMVVSSSIALGKIIFSFFGVLGNRFWEQTTEAVV